MEIAYGADLSLTHGSVVRVEMDTENVVTFAETIYKWDKKDSHRLSLKSTPDEIFLKVRDIFYSFPVNPTVNLAIDWQLVFWNTRRLLIVQMALFMGMMYSRFRLADLEFVIPAQIREFWGLKTNAPKQDVQDTVLKIYPLPIGFKQYANEDDIDAYILALYMILNTTQEE